MATPSRNDIKVVRDQARPTDEERNAMLARFEKLGRKLADVSDDEMCDALEAASEEDGQRKRLLRTDVTPPD